MHSTRFSRLNEIPLTFSDNFNFVYALIGFHNPNESRSEGPFQTELPVLSTKRNREQKEIS